MFDKLLFFDPESASATYALIFKYMKWKWKDNIGRGYIPDQQKILIFLRDLESYLTETNHHAQSGRLLVQSTNGIIIYRLTPDDEHSFVHKFEYEPDLKTFDDFIGKYNGVQHTHYSGFLTI